MMQVDLEGEIRDRKGHIFRLKEEIKCLQDAMVVCGADKPGPEKAPEPEPIEPPGDDEGIEDIGAM